MEISSGAIKKAQKIAIYGVEGIGKTYFASKFPNPVFIDTEGSTDYMDVRRTPKPSSWTMLMNQVQYFISNPTVCDTLVIDTADWAERLCIEHICAKGKVDGIEGFGYGKGYVYLEEEFGRFLNKLSEVIEAGTNVVITAHAEIKKIEQPEEIGGYDHWQMKLEKKTMPLLKEWCDMLLFAKFSVQVVNVDNQGAQKGKNKAQGGKRVMYTTHTPWWDAKNRHDLLDELPLDYDEIKHCIITRNGKPAEQPPREIQPKCSVCGESQFDTPSGMTCKNGHGGAEPITLTTAPEPPIEKQFEQMVSQPKEPVKEFVPADWSDIERKPKPNIPKALADLMKEQGISVAEVQKAVADRGYYPIDTPIEKYDPGFIDGVLVGAWGQMCQIIMNARIDNGEIPH